MANNEIFAKVAELRELRRMAEELEAQIEGITDELKAHMNATDTDTITGPDFKITWKAIESTRLDTKALKAAAPELCARFTKTTSSRRFTVA